MGCSHLIQPVVGLYSFSLFMAIPLLQQYMYARLWEQHSDVPYALSGGVQCANGSSNLTATHMVKQKKQKKKSQNMFIIFYLFYERYGFDVMHRIA